MSNTTKKTANVGCKENDDRSCRRPVGGNCFSFIKRAVDLFW